MRRKNDKKQRNKIFKKNRTKTLGKELNKMEISNPSDAEFKTLVIRMLLGTSTT